MATNKRKPQTRKAYALSISNSVDNGSCVITCFAPYGRYAPQRKVGAT